MTMTLLPDLLGTSPADLIAGDVDRPKATADEARARLAEIKKIAPTFVRALRKISDAYACRDWEALGYDSWQQYRDAEFGELLDRAVTKERREAVAELRAKGMSVREIAAVVRASASTVHDDIARCSESEHLPVKVTGADGKAYAASRPKAEVALESATQAKCTECGAPVSAASVQLGYKRCDGCDVPREAKPVDVDEPAEQLWMSVRRKGLNHHLIPAGSDKTACDRWVGVDGKGQFDNGILVNAEAVAALESKRCPQCWPETATMPAGQAAGDRIVESIEQKRAIAAARTAARTVAADLLEDVNAIVAGSKAGARDVITPALVAALRQAVDVLEAEMLGREALGGGR